MIFYHFFFLWWDTSTDTLHFVYYLLGRKTFSILLGAVFRSLQIRLTKDRLVGEKQIFIHYICAVTEDCMSILGLICLLREEQRSTSYAGRGRKGTYMTFWQDKWTSGRPGGKRGLWLCVWVWYKSLQELRVASQGQVSSFGKLSS